jgi:hypothetical protein
MVNMVGMGISCHLSYMRLGREKYFTAAVMGQVVTTQALASAITEAIKA